MNQIGSIQVPRFASVQGEAHVDAAVTVDGQVAERTGPYFMFWKDYGAEPDAHDDQFDLLTVMAELQGAGAGGSPARSEKEAMVALPATPRNFVYDDDGNLLRDGRGVYTWNGENRLVAAATDPGLIAAGKGGVRLVFAYDSQGRRFRKVRSIWNGSVWVEESAIYFVYDGWNLIAEIKDGVVNETYLWGIDLSESLQGAGGVGGLLAVIESDGIASLPVYDGNGNILAYVDGITGEETARYDYGPFGEPIRRTGEDYNFGFSTKYLDEETGWYYYGFRYYDPETGRWPNRDPIGERGGLNLYGFVGNDGVNAWDFNGLKINKFVCCDDSHIDSLKEADKAVSSALKLARALFLTGGPYADPSVAPIYADGSKAFIPELTKEEETKFAPKYEKFKSYLFVKIRAIERGVNDLGYTVICKDKGLFNDDGTESAGRAPDTAIRRFVRGNKITINTRSDFLEGKKSIQDHLNVTFMHELSHVFSYTDDIGRPFITEPLHEVLSGAEFFDDIIKPRKFFDNYFSYLNYWYKK